MKTNILKVIILAGMLVLFISSIQGLNYFELVSFRDLPGDSTAAKEKVEVEEDFYAAAVRVEMPEQYFEEVSLEQETFRKDIIDDNLYIFFSPEETRLSVQVPGYEDVAIFPPHREGFQPGKVYHLVINPLLEAELTIFVEPEDAEIFVNGEPWYDFTGEVEMGTYEIFIERDGYEEIHEIIDVNEPVVTLHYIMSEMENE